MERGLPSFGADHFGTKRTLGYWWYFLGKQEGDIISKKVEISGSRRAETETIVPAGAMTETIMVS